jgi:hypothetical protein
MSSSASIATSAIWVRGGATVMGEYSLLEAGADARRPG